MFAALTQKFYIYIYDLKNFVNSWPSASNFNFFSITKAELLQEGIIFLIHLFARAILLMKKLKIEEIKAT